MPREPIPRRAKEVKREPTDYVSLIQPAFQPSQVVGHRKKEEEAKKEAATKSAAATPKRKLTQKQRNGKPTYARMIANALVHLQERTGSSGPAIAKHIEANYGKNLPDNFKIFLRRALKNAVDEGILRHEGARYRLSSSGKYKLGLKKRTPKKKSSSSSSSSSSKKRKSSSSSRSKSPSRSSKKSSKDKKKKKTKSSSSSSSSSSKAKEAKKSSSSRSTRSSSSSRASEKSSSSSSSSKSSEPKLTPAGYDHFWQFQEGSRWLPYDATASDVVEKAYLDYKKNPGMCDVRAVKSGQWQYQVDFLNNKQTNIQHENHTVRSIRRVAVGKESP